MGLKGAKGGDVGISKERGKRGLIEVLMETDLLIQTQERISF